jgi:hypothetical protein
MPWGRARVALDHSLGSKEALDLLPHLGDVVTLLCKEGKV